MCQQDPERVPAERRTEWEDQQIDEAETKRQETTRRRATPKEDGGPHVGNAPNQGEDANRNEYDGRQARGQRNGLPLGSGRQRERPGREEKHRHSHHDSQCTPEPGEDAEKCDVAVHQSPGLGHEDAKLDARGWVVAGSDAEVKAGAVQDTSGNCDLQLMVLELTTASLATDARLRPRLAATPAGVTSTSYRELKWEYGAVACLAPRQLNRRAQGRGAFVGDKGAPHAIDGKRHRRKVDDDFVGEAAPVQLAAGANRQ